MSKRATAALLVLLGCKPEPGSATKAGPDSAGDTSSDTADTGQPDTGDTGSVPPPCGDGSWGAIGSASAIHVAESGSITGDGSSSDPVHNLEQALELARLGTPRIALWPGSHQAEVTLVGTGYSDTPDDGLEIVGCSADEVELVGDDILLTINGATGVRISALTLAGGLRGLSMGDGAEATLSDARVRGSEVAGIVIDDHDTWLTATDVELEDLDDDGDGSAPGITIDGATLHMTGGGIWGAARAGLIAHEATLSLEAVTIADTATSAGGTLGRGLHLESYSTATLSQLDLSGNHDAGIFSQASTLALSDSVIQGTGAATDTTGALSSGDGVVIVQFEEGAVLDPSTFSALLDQNEISGNDRAGVLVADVVATLNDNLVQDNGYEVDGVSTFVQADGSMAGADDYANLAESPLDLNWEAVSSTRGGP